MVVSEMDRGVADFRETPGAVLIDVRTSEEYAEGHVPGSINIPLQVFNKIEECVPETDTPVFVYCFSGARSRRAAGAFEKMGYTDVRNIGGISDYNGELEM